MRRRHGRRRPGPSLTAVAPAAPRTPLRRTGTAVVGVLTGDTILVRVAGKERTLRRWGIAAPRGSACDASEARAELAWGVEKGAVLRRSCRSVVPPATARTFVAVANNSGLALNTCR